MFHVGYCLDEIPIILIATFYQKISGSACQKSSSPAVKTNKENVTAVYL